MLRIVLAASLLAFTVTARPAHATPLADAIHHAPDVLADVSIGSAIAGLAEQHAGSILISIVLFLLGTPFVASHLDTKRKRELALAVYHGYHIAADVDAELAPGGSKSTADKIAAVLKAADGFLLAQGWRPLKDGESAAVSALTTSLSGQAKVGAPAASPSVP